MRKLKWKLILFGALILGIQILLLKILEQLNKNRDHSAKRVATQAYVDQKGNQPTPIGRFLADRNETFGEAGIQPC